MSGEISELFTEALELAPGERDRFVAGIAARDPDLASALARLLARAEDESSPLDRSPWTPFVPSAGLAPLIPLTPLNPLAPLPTLPPLTASGNAATEPQRPDFPDRIGPYTIVRELGRGGMGRVFLAEERTEEYSRSIALKVIDRPIVDGDALRRFRDEVRILSILEHPGIARFLSGGKSPEGVWYLALEYVDGDDLLTWAREHDLDARGRVQLFRSVLDPIAFAHAKRIVHRDLKPTHLLIDRQGRPRLLDFGISKLLAAEGGAELAETRTEARALTPAYAAPEQFRGEPATPATDVFALGVVLYELLSGRRPFLETSAAARDLEHAILHSDPAPPSTAARRSRAAQKRSKPQPDTGKARSGANTTTARVLNRDLDAICLKALRKNPADRYVDADAMAADLDAHLSGRPVGARRGGWRYRTGRSLYRHRVATALAAALVIAAGAGIFGISAYREAARARPAVPAVPALALLSQAKAAELEKEFAAHPGNSAIGAQLVIALVREGRMPEAEVALGRVRQIPGSADEPFVDHAEGVLATSRGELQRALALSSRSLELAEKQRRGDLVPTFRLAHARALSDLGQTAASLADLRTALREANAANDDVSRAIALNDLAVAKLQEGQFRAGEWLLLQALAAARRAHDDVRIAVSEINLAGLAFERGRPDLAAAYNEETALTFRRLGRERRAAGVDLEHSRALRDLGSPAEADRLLERAIAGLRKVEDQQILSAAFYDKALTAIDRGEFPAAEALATAIGENARASGKSALLALVDDTHARIELAHGNLSAARRHFAAAWTMQRQEDDLNAAFSVALCQGDLELRAGNPAVAHALIERELAALPAREPDSSSDFFGEILLARADLALGAIASAERRLSARRAEGESSPSLSRQLAFVVADSERADAAGDAAARDALLRRAITIAERVDHSEDAERFRQALESAAPTPTSNQQ
ncbi:MAG: protein kinase [Thermoanaerobaculia bacterium]